MHTLLELFQVFLRLGLTSFGGPVAHLGFVRAECVERRRWLSEDAYADLVALCQFLPGPASSQVVYGVGLTRAGLPGAFMAWLGFTLPSAVLMLLAAMGMGQWGGQIPEGVLTGLKLAAVAVVADAVLGMGQRLCPDLRRRGLALAAFAVALGVGGTAGQFGALGLGALVGGLALRARAIATDPGAASGGTWRWVIPVGVFAGLLLVLPWVASATGDLRWLAADRLYRAGALVFGGGHVVLPWLDALVVEPGWMNRDDFLAGYGLAQALPGPLFSFAVYLGASMPAPMGGAAGGLIALVAIYLPAWLLVSGLLPVWGRLRARTGMAAVLAGVNAAVVGLLLAALIHPVGSSAVAGPVHAAAAAVAWLVLRVGGCPPWLLVFLSAAAGGVVFGAGFP